ncbi:MAG: CoA activase [Candidatus Coatesbacteria bacterium]|nr:CoA activase [Candidatus Coatesbacteria bacterium]
MLVGIDVGSVAVKAVLMDSNRSIVEHHYKRIKGRPIRMVGNILKDILARHDRSKIRTVCATGAGGRLIAELLNGIFVNEVIAQYLAGLQFNKDVRTIIDIGGEDSKLMLLGKDKATGEVLVQDFEMNTVCAAGTGSFLDQQASRLGVSIEDEFSRLALKSETPPRIAGRCSVFAKTDMIHLQQEGTPVHDIVGGLCYAMARSFKSNVVKGAKMRPLVSFQGGVASNEALVKALKEILGLSDGEMLVHELHSVAGAIGACLHYLKSKDMPERYFKGLDRLEAFLEAPSGEQKSLPILSLKDVSLPTENVKHCDDDTPVKVYIGIDVGSISTNVVAIDDDLNLLAKCYLMTAGRPIDAVATGLSEVREQLPGEVEVAGVGTTGSGRYMTGELVGADVVRNEITAQATAAAVIDPNVDTIFEIGGQDSKYIGLENGVVVDFEMNKVCAAGTGSFLEEQAEKLGVSIKKEFANEALGSKNPVRLGERCTVFMESSVTHFQQEGAKREDLLAGLAYSIVYNYLNRVVGTKKIGKNIFFQGGVAFNHSVCAAFSSVTGRKITVPPNHEVTGAIGAAVLAKEAMKGKGESKFKGFNLKDRSWELETFECHDCPNICEVRKVTLQGEPPIFYGSRCEKFDVRKKSEKAANKIPDLFAERDELLMRWQPKPKGDSSKPSMTVGIPRALLFFELFPMWATYLDSLGIEVVLSAKTNKHVIHEGVEAVKSETCFPVKVMHGHVLDLLKKGVDKVFLPSVINMPKETEGFVNYFNCPLVQSIPYTIGCGIDKLGRERILSPILYMQRGRKDTIRRLVKFAQEHLGASKSAALAAAEAAIDAQQEFKRGEAELVKRAEKLIGEHKLAVVILGRPYNTNDPFVNLNLPKKLRELDVLPVPMALVKPDIEVTLKEHGNMYWRYGQRILGTAVSIAKNPKLYGLYITNFGCGPDSFISQFFSEIMDEKPFLQIEIDEHSADVGAITRCEAFLDSIAGKKHKASVEPRLVESRYSGRTRGVKNRTLYVPSMSDHAYPFCAALQRYGIDAQVIPEADEESLELGRRHTTGRECFPCIVTTGDMVKLCQSKGFDRKKAMFMMPTTSGPCRFGQYNHVQKMVLENIGFSDIPVLAPDQDRADNFHQTLKDVPLTFYLHGYQGMVGVDYIERLARRIRPYERIKGRTDEVYDYSLKEITEATKAGDVLNTLKKCAALFSKIEWDKTQSRPRIGLVGEIYVRSHRFSNRDLVKRLEALGAEVWRPTFAEWLYYLTYIHGRDAASQGKWTRAARLRVIHKLQHVGERAVKKAIADSVRIYEDETVLHAIHAAVPYIDVSFHGEAVLSIGKMIEYIDNGATGVINIMPFGCLPGTIVTAMLKKLHDDFDGIPALSINYDGLEDPAEQTRLEAFVHQAKQRAERMSARGEKPKY